MPINPSKKGGRNERGIVNLFKKWTNYEFARTPSSGGLHWKKAHTSGDIVCIDNLHGTRFPFSIEAKFYHDIEFHYLIDGSIGKKTAKIIHFWDQTVRDAITSNRIPLLFFRKNMMKTDMHFVALPTDFFNIWVEKVGKQILKYGYLIYERGSYNFVIINSFDLFETDYIEFYKSGRKLLKNEKGN